MFRQIHPPRLLFWLAPIMAWIAAGCATSPPQAPTTLLGSVDLERMTDEMARSIVDSDVDLSDAVVVADRVVNRTNHIMEEGEKRLFLARLRAQLAQTEVMRERGVRFVAGPEMQPELFVEPAGPDDAGRGPTHALAATFLTLTNVDRLRREDTYECAFELLNLRSREVVWEDAYRVRYAVGRGRIE